MNKKPVVIQRICWQNHEIVGYLQGQVFYEHTIRKIRDGLHTFLFIRLCKGEEQTAEVHATTPEVALAVLTDDGLAINNEFDDYRFWLNGLTDKENPTILVRKTVTYTDVPIPKLQSMKKVH